MCVLIETVVYRSGEHSPSEGGIVDHGVHSCGVKCIYIFCSLANLFV